MYSTPIVCNRNGQLTIIFFCVGQALPVPSLPLPTSAGALFSYTVRMHPADHGTRVPFLFLWYFYSRQVLGCMTVGSAPFYLWLLWISRLDVSYFHTTPMGEGRVILSQFIQPDHHWEPDASCRLVLSQDGMLLGSGAGDGEPWPKDGLVSSLMLSKHWILFQTDFLFICPPMSDFIFYHSLHTYLV